jgi:hypothetical protein
MLNLSPKGPYARELFERGLQFGRDGSYISSSTDFVYLTLHGRHYHDLPIIQLDYFHGCNYDTGIPIAYVHIGFPFPYVDIGADDMVAVRWNGFVKQRIGHLQRLYRRRVAARAARRAALYQSRMRQCVVALAKKWLSERQALRAPTASG